MSPDIITATGDLFPKVTGVASSKGVAMNAPPAAILGDVSKMVADAVSALPVGSRGALVGIATTNASGGVNVNLALATKVGEKVTVIAWAGKSWGQPIAGGAAVQVAF